jgi:hypothetical protein
MKNTVFLLTLVLIFSACSKDIQPPEIGSVSVSMNDTIQNVFTIELDATDESGIRKVELYINDSLKTETDKVPFKFSWNTLEVSDGKYSLRFVVSDNQNNKVESTYDVVVNNCLLIVNSESMYDGTYHIAVADDAGNVLDSLTFRKNTINYLKPHKPFSGEAVNLIWFRTDLYPFMHAIIHVKRGSVYNMSEKLEFAPTKYIRVHFIKDVPSFSSIKISTDRISITLNSMADTVNVPQYITYTPGHKLLLQIKTDQGGFYRLVDINEALDLHEMTIRLSTINKPEEHRTISFPSPGYSLCFIDGTVKETDIFNAYSLTVASGGNTLDIWYPNEYYLKYLTQIVFTPQGTNKRYSEYYNGSVPAFFQTLNADIQILDSNPGNFSASLSGIFDIYFLEYYNLNHNMQMFITAPSGCTSWKLPDPGILFKNSEFNLSKFHTENVTLDEYSGITDNKLYDLNVRTHRLNVTDPHYSRVTIRLQ